MTLPPAIDIHSHFFPERYLKLIETEGAAVGARIDRSNPKGPVVVAAGSSGAPLSPAYWDLDLRVKTMNRIGVGVQALSLTSPMTYFAKGDLGRRLAQTFNDGIAEAHTAFPDRFIGC